MNLKDEIESYKLLLEEERHIFKVLSEANITLSTLSLDELLEKVLQIIVRETMADRGCLILLNNNNDELEPKVTHEMGSFEEELEKNPSIQKLIQQVMKTGENTCVFDSYLDSRVENVVTADGRGIISIICLPLRSKEKNLGVVYVDGYSSNPEKMDFSTGKIQLMGALASQAGVTIENTKLYEKTQRQKENIIKQYEIMKRLGSVLDMEYLFVDIMDTVISTTRAERGFLMLYDEKSGDLDFKIARNYKKETIPEDEMEVNLNIAYSVIERKQFTRINMNENKKRSILCAPLINEGKILGVIYVDTTYSKYDFDEDAEYFLSTLSGGLAIIIKNAELYSELNKAHQKLVRLDEMKSKFINLASHELRTPLTSVYGNVYLLKTYLGENEKYAHTIDILNQNISRLVSTVNDIVNISTLAPSTKKMPFEFTEVDIFQLIKEIMIEKEPIFEKRNQKFSWEVHEDIGSIIADRDYLKQAINYILNNAIRYTPDEGEISLIAKKYKKNLSIKINDTGIGIPKEELDNIFMKFYEVQDVTYHSSGTFEYKSGGSGLGLSIAKAIVEGHGGYIDVKSQLDIGSCFTIVIPLHKRKNF